MHRLLVFALVAATLGAAALTLATAPELPERVASHFGAGGRANGWMSRDGYVVFMLVFGIGLPWLVYGLAGWLMARSPRSLKHAEYWLAPERREATLGSMRSFAAAVAVLVALGVAAAHLAILEAHRRSPPTLDEGPFIAGVIVFAVAIVAIAILNALRFRSPAGPARRA